MNRTTTTVLREILRRFEELETLVATALLRYERVADLRQKVRAGELAQVVADHLNVDNGPTFRRELAVALKAVGIRRTRVHGTPWYRGLRPRVRR